MFNKYYQDELQFLRELGEEFSRAHPNAAHFLAGTGRDPDVERLLEGFAFLAGRIRQKLDDEFPEVAHSLIQLLWPHYLRPVPSMAILEFAPVLAALRQSQRVERGCEVHSVPVEGTACRFRTCCEVTLHPLSIEDVAMDTRATGATRLKLGFRLWNQAKPESLRLDRLRLYLHGDPAVAYALYHHLCRHVAEARVAPGGGDAEGAPFRPLRVVPAGFAEEESILPFPPAALPGYRHLQEYFALPQKFLFLDLLGLERLRELPAGDRFEVEVRFDRQLPATLRPTREEVRLYCTPVVNLFPQDGDPIRLDRAKTEYRVRPAGRDPFHFEIYSVDRTSAVTPAGDREIPDFYAFSRGHGPAPPSCRYVRLRPSVVDERVDTYVSFVDAQGNGALPDAETVQLKLTCTNRRLAEALRVGDVQVPSDSSPAFVKFHNLTAATPSVAPPLGGELHWKLVSHLALNYASLADVRALRGILELYNFHAARDPRAARANTLRMEGLQEVRAEPDETLSRGCLLRGTSVTLDVLEDRFADEGDLYLFATVLNEFLALHGTLNSFTRLTVKGLQRGEVMTWPHRIGRDLL